MTAMLRADFQTEGAEFQYAGRHEENRFDSFHEAQVLRA
jgi:hypothetical protein